MSNEADSSTETERLPELPDWLQDDDERTESQASADDAAAPESTQDDGQPETAFEAAQRRDQAGRFTRSAESPTGFVPQDAQAQAAAKSVQTEAEAQAADDTEPFTYRADGREYQIPGLRVPEAHAEQVRQLLAEGMHHRTTWQAERQAFEAERQQFGQQVQGERAQIKAAMDIVSQLFSDENKLAEMYADWKVQGPALLEKARNAGIMAELEMYRNQGNQQVAQQAQDATETGLWDSMSELIDTQFPNVFDQYDMTALYAELVPERIVQVADRDYPEYGYQAGDILLDQSALYGKMAMRASEIAQRDRTAQMAAGKVAKVAANNAAVLGRGRKPPPTVGARSGGVPGGQRPEIKTAKDWQRDLDTDD